MTIDYNKRMIVFLIFGVTGDLAKRKLIPGIYNLIRDKKIKDFHILGIARRKVSMNQIISSSEYFIKNPYPNIVQKLKKYSSYLQLDFFNEKDYLKLKKVLENLGRSNKIFHLATMSESFEEISKNLCKILKPEAKTYSRIIFEKPFGNNLSSAKKLNKAISKAFNERQIYRIDHYLGKELVGNIALIRFTNRIFEPLWNNKNIHSVQITLDEDIGIENRGPYYDKYGAIKDIVQNHLMQLLSLVAMEPPKLLEGDYIRDEKVKVLKKLKIKDILLGQYEGYKNEKGVDKNSNTETFAALKMEINNQRWRGIPFFLKTGKMLYKKETKIVIEFKELKCLLLKSCPIHSNNLTIRIQPDEGISFELNVKTPGKDMVAPIKMDFCHSCIFGPNTPEAYENLFEEVIEGDQSSFVRKDEIEAAWSIIDKIKKHKPYLYNKGSKGPKELEKFNKKHNLTWK